MPATILVIDDDQGLLILIQELLRSEKWQVETAASGAEAFAWLQKNTADLLLLDLKLADIAGPELIDKLAKAGRVVPFVIVTGQGDERVAVEMMKRGALDYLVKDINFLEFVPTVVKRALASIANDKRLAEAELEAKKSRSLIQDVLNSLAANIAVLDQIGTIIAVNEPWRRFAMENDCFSLLGTTIGCNYLDACRRAVVDKELDAQEILSGIQDVMNRDRMDYSIEYPCHSPGKERWFLMTVTPLSNEEGGVVVSHMDITRRKQAEEALREADEFGKQIIAGAQAGIVVCDQMGQIIVWNPFMEQITGLHSEGVLSKIALDVFPFSRRPQLKQILDLALAGEAREAADIPFDHADTGKRYWTTAHIAPWRDAQEKIVGVVIAVRDITERRRLEAGMIEISDQEQQRIGQDLHDGLGQQLTGLEMKNFLLLEDLATLDLAANRDNLQRQAHKISVELRNCVTATRALARGLAPMNIRTEGLVGALRQLAHNVCIPKKLNCRFVCGSSVTLNDPQIEGHLYRIAQEALNNSLKHARPKNIQMNLSVRGDELRLQIKDDGCGLPKSQKNKTGMGLEVMEHRARVIGASLDIKSSTGQGVCITCALPLKNHEHQAICNQTG
ncbi:MAG: response regulator receiver sensor signal transduction histidine kinase [Verrucomicrobia bacterium]|jgi:PAS domain S-box-containing protein|nr:response regulator receiver sensor signal transduction histidine kinase [Verrucomicrobiota bacterium]